MWLVVRAQLLEVALGMLEHSGIVKQTVSLRGINGLQPPRKLTVCVTKTCGSVKIIQQNKSRPLSAACFFSWFSAF
jgi:hypothetical protein